MWRGDEKKVAYFPTDKDLGPENGDGAGDDSDYYVPREE